MAIFLLGTDIKPRVAAWPNSDPSLQGHAALLHRIRQSLQANDTVEPTGREIVRLDAQFGNGGRTAHRRRLE
jgi:hypothetical protein